MSCSTFLARGLESPVRILVVGSGSFAEILSLGLDRRASVHAPYVG